MKGSLWRQHVVAFAAFLALAAVQTWPLPLRMGTHLTGSPGGDTGVYVWNLWVFSHEIFESGTTPLSTFEILPLADPGTPGTDLSLHNYTVATDVMAIPLLGWLGVVRTFNLLYLFNNALAGFGLYLLARRLTGQGMASFIAGLMFAWSPYIVTRGMGHFSLAEAAPLPIFMLMLYRAWDSQRLRDAILAGAVLAWASFSDPYYAVYCLMLGAIFVSSKMLDVNVQIAARPASGLVAIKHLLHVGIAVVAALIVGVHWLGNGSVSIGPVHLSMHSLHTPMLVLTLLVVARLAMLANLSVTAAGRPAQWFLVRATLACGVMAALLMSPTLYAMGRRAVTGDVTTVPVLWRSSAPGVDLLSFVLPNPNHPLAPAAWAERLSAGPGGYLDQVASLSLIGLAIIFAAWRWAGFRPARMWLVITIGFATLALGPFVQIAGVNTLIPTPWTLLRYAPIVGSARMPARFVAVVSMGSAVLCAFALAALSTRFPSRRRLILGASGVLMAAELIAAPRTLYSAAVPAVFDVIAKDPRPVRVLELPTGIRDGLSSIGDYNAGTQYFQTFHRKGLIGGYLSRVPPSIKARYCQMPVTSALIDISEGRRLTMGQINRALAGADDFVRWSHLGYVVINQARTSDDLRTFATILLGLTKIGESDGFELYVTKYPSGVGDPPARRP
jgi:hypothetical protein